MEVVAVSTFQVFCSLNATRLANIFSLFIASLSESVSSESVWLVQFKLQEFLKAVFKWLW